MKLINGAVIRDTNWPGCIGDSMRETSNLQCMLRKIDGIYMMSQEWHQLLTSINLTQFRTPNGYIRHRDAPHEGLQIAPDGYQNAGQSIVVKDNWREKDTSGDQYILWYREIPYYNINGVLLQKEMKKRVLMNFGRYGNGDFIQPGFAAELFNWNWAREGDLIAQAELFKAPVRYSDQSKKFEPSSASSADYWVWSAIAGDLNIKEDIRKMVPKEILKQKFESYLKDEPNSQWYLDIACKFADLYF